MPFEARKTKFPIFPLNHELHNLIKRECPLGPSHIANMWHMMKNQNFSYFAQRNIVGCFS